MLAFLPPSVAATGYVRPSPFEMTPHGGSSSCYGPHVAPTISYDDYQHQLRLEELRRAEAAIQAAIAEEETRRRRRELEQRAAFELALRQQQAAEELQRRRRRQQQQQQQVAEARLLAAAMARRAELAAQQERARQIAIAAALQQAREEEEQYRRRLESARQHQQQQYRLRQQLEARRQRARQQAEVDVAPALVQLVLDIFASQQQEEESEIAQEAEGELAQQEVSKAPVTAPVSNGSAAPEPTSSSSNKSVEPASDLAPTAENTLQEEEAAKVLQRRFRRHAARRSALDHLSTLATDLVSHRRAFEAPTELHFQSSPVSSDATVVPSSQQPLAYDKSNKAFLAYEDFLVSLLSKIDAVESNGDKVVQRARKELVRQVEKELGRLDELKHQEWERQSGASSPAASDVEEAEEGKANKESEQEVVDGESRSHTRHVYTSMNLTLACYHRAAPSESASDVKATPVAMEEPSDKSDPKEDIVEESAAAEAETRAHVDAPAQAESDLSAEPSASTTEPASSPAEVVEDAPAQVVASPSAPLAKSADPANLNTSRSLPADGATADDEDEGSSRDELESAAIEEVLKRAKALGERVEALERADAEAPEQEQEQEKQTADDTTSAPAHSTANSAPAPSAASETKSAEGDAKSDAGTEDFEML